MIFLDMCKGNKKWSDCPGADEPRCNKFDHEKYKSVVDQYYRCFARCVCKEGFLLISKNECIAAQSDECGGLYNIPTVPHG